MDKLTFRFNNQGSQSNFKSKDILGGKGSNLAQMAKLGLPVPPGFTISTQVCDYFYRNNKQIPKKIIHQTKKEISLIEKISKKKFGNVLNPLLVSVRSGSRVSMPGMMDTILNLGLNDIFRHFNKSKQEYTFWDYFAGSWQKNYGMRIDHFLVSNNLLENIKSININKKPRSKIKPSDHTPIELEIN